MARGTRRVGRSDSSPKDPADSKPAKERNPAVAASAMVEAGIPSGMRSTSASRPCPRGAVPPASATTITAMRTRMRATATASKPSRDRAAVRTSRLASQYTRPQPARAIGSHGTPEAMPAWSRKARPNTAKAAIETAGKTR